MAQADTTQTAEETQTRMTFGQHLEELRKRLMAAAFGVVIAMAFCMVYTNEIIGFLIGPYIYALDHGSQQVNFQYTSPAALVLNYLSIGFKAGLVVAAPWIIYQVWLFIGAGLYQKERRLVYKYLGPAIALFMIGIAFFYLIVLPLTLKFLVEFSNSTWVEPPKPPAFLKYFGGTEQTHNIDTTTMPTGAQAMPVDIPILDGDPPMNPTTTQPGSQRAQMWYNYKEKRFKIRLGDTLLTPILNNAGSQFMPFPKLDEYLSFVLFMGLMFGVSFELPMIMLILSKLRMVKVKTWRSKRKVAYFVISIAAAIMAASPDIFSMMSLMVPLVALYEIGIIVAAIGARKTINDEPEEPEEPEQAG